MPNQALERMPGSAVTFPLQSNVVGALPGIAQLSRCGIALIATSPRKQTMSVILDIDLDYFGLFEQPIAELERLLTWAGRPVDFIVAHHHEAYTRWKQMVTAHLVQPPYLIIHADEHHDMMSETPPTNFGSFIYFVMRHWPDCRVVWVTPQPIDYPDMWLSDCECR